MRLLILSSDLSDYDCKTHQAIFIEELAKKGYKITYITSNKNKPEHKNIENIDYDTHSEPSEELIEKLRKNKYDIAISFSVKGLNWFEKIYWNRIPIIKIKTICQVLDVPVFRLKSQYFTQYHYDYQKEWNRYFHLLKICDLIISNTLITKNILIEKGISNEKIKNIYYGISIPNIPLEESKEKKRQVVFVSRLRWYKGLDILLYALSLIKEKLQLHVIGFDDEEKPSLKLSNGNIPFRYLLMADQLGIKIIFHGAISDQEKFKIIKESKLAVFPDYSKTISGLFPLEAVYCGTPCIVGDFPINRERFKNTVEYVKTYYDTGILANHIKLNFENDFRITDIEKDWILKNRSHISYTRELDKTIKKLVKA